jgi:hypothetical protein
MELTELYEKGEALLRQKDIGWLLDGVETGFVSVHDRKVLDRYTFRECCVDASEAKTTCRVMGVVLSITGELKRLMTMVGAPDPVHVPKDILLADLNAKEGMETSFNAPFCVGSELLFQVFTHVHEK